MLEFPFEFVFQIVFEAVAEGLLEAGSKRTARVLRYPAVRYGLGGAAGFAFGVWWGDRLSGGHRPSLFWISLAVAIGSGVAALRRSRGMKRPHPSTAVDTLGRPAPPATAEGFSWRAVVDPRRWPVPWECGGAGRSSRFVTAARQLRSTGRTRTVDAFSLPWR